MTLDQLEMQTVHQIREVLLRQHAELEGMFALLGGIREMQPAPPPSRASVNQTLALARHLARATPTAPAA